MGLEVELKAHVEDPSHIQKRIEALRGISTAVCEIKEDIYFCKKGEDALFRLRTEQRGPSFAQMQGSLLFTYKTKQMKEGIEVNDEVEFTAPSDQYEGALQFFLSLGFVIYITKTKKGYCYTYAPDKKLPPLTLELVEVVGLGWFVEMEYVLENTLLVEEAKLGLLALLAELGIEKSAIESGYYMHLLKETKKRPEA